jgi:hypothetical protein
MGPAEATGVRPGVLGALRAAARGVGRTRPWPWIALATLWMGGIWWLSSRAVDVGPKTLAMRWLANLVHAPLYGLLCLWWACALAPRGEARHAPVPTVLPARRATALPARRAWLAVGLTVAWGVSDELHQARVPSRTASALDVVTDAVAALVVAWVAAYVSAAAASELGARGRLAGGAAACLAAALLATL